jgi:5'-deoxynucleotidase YfbR-like HD superfamily hydrolase
MFLADSFSWKNNTTPITQNTQIQSTISEATLKVAEQLKDVPRVWNNEETVWTHTEGTIELAKKYKEIIALYGWSLSWVIDLLKLHDIPEILTGDMDPRFTNPNTKFYLEEWAMTSLISNQNDRSLWYEYSLGGSLEAQFAKAFDKLQFLNELIKRWDKKEYYWALGHYRKYFIPFPELLKIIDTPIFYILETEN